MPRRSKSLLQRIQNVTSMIFNVLSMCFACALHVLHLCGLPDGSRWHPMALGISGILLRRVWKRRPPGSWSVQTHRHCDCYIGRRSPKLRSCPNTSTSAAMEQRCPYQKPAFFDFLSSSPCGSALCLEILYSVEKRPLQHYFVPGDMSKCSLFKRPLPGHLSHAFLRTGGAAKPVEQLLDDVSERLSVPRDAVERRLVVFLLSHRWLRTESVYHPDSEDRTRTEPAWSAL